MPTPDFPVGVPSWYTDEQLRGYVGMLAQRLFNLLCNLDSLNVTRLDAGTVQVYDLNGGTGTITLTGDGMTINNGTYNTFTVDVNGNVTMTSATIQSASGYPKVVIDPTNNVFRAYQDETHYVEISPVYNNAPTIKMISPQTTFDLFVNPDTTGNATMSNSSGRIDINSANNVRFNTSPSGTLQVPDASNVIQNGASGTITYVKDVTGPTFGTITVTKGIITSFT